MESIVFDRYYDEMTDEYKWNTWSSVNTRVSFCQECNSTINKSLGYCIECYHNEYKKMRRELAEDFYLDDPYAESEEGYYAARAWYLGQLGEPPTLTQAYHLGKKLLTWYETEHVCNGEWVDDGCCTYYECDGREDPRCPMNTN